VRLQAIERGVLGFAREDDIPSERIPAAWFEFLRTGRGDEVQRVLEHNRHDVLSLITLAAVLLELAIPGSAPADAGSPHDVLELAEQRWQAGDRDAARTWLAACKPSRAHAKDGRREVRRARTTKRVFGPSHAEGVWRRAIELPGCGVEPYEELAKVLEHSTRDMEGARELVLTALARFGGVEAVAARLRHRLARLERRITSPRLPRLPRTDRV